MLGPLKIASSVRHCELSRPKKFVEKHDRGRTLFYAFYCPLGVGQGILKAEFFGPQCG
jgi:hypothetical protein